MTTRILRFDRVLLILGCFFLFVGSVLAGITVWQGTQRNAKIDHIDEVVTEAKEATEDSRAVLKAAIASQSTPEARAQQEKTRQAVVKIDRILEILENN